MTSPKEVRLVLRREIVNLFVVEKGAEKLERESVNKNGKISKGKFFDTQTPLNASLQ